VVVEVARGRSPAQILGGYSVTATNATYHAWPALRWIVYHVAALDLSLWILPFAALIVLGASARHLDRELRVFVAAAVALTAWLVLEVGIFASTWSQRIEERNLFYLAPLFLLALLAWIERGQPRPPRATVAAAGVAAALPGVIPFTQLLNINAESDTPFLQPWWYLGDRVVGQANVALVAVAAAALLAAAFLWLTPRYAGLLPVLVAAGFLVTWLPLELWTHSFPRLSAYAYETGITRERSWIDRTVGSNADVTLVWTGDNPYRGWENEFWNRSIRRVYDLGPSPLLAGAESQLHAAAGLLLDDRNRPVRVQYVLADPAAEIRGTQIASDEAKRMVLYRVDGPLRTLSSVRGWYADTWTAPHFVWQRARCEPGTLQVRLRSDRNLFPGIVQRIAVSGTTDRRVILLPTTKTETVSLPLRPTGGTCTIRFAVTPARKPAADPRTLGVHVDFFRYAAGA
jgi:hypothetical protein